MSLNSSTDLILSAAIWASTQPLIEMSTSFLSGGLWAAGRRVRIIPHRHLWADWLENVGTSASHGPLQIPLHVPTQKEANTWNMLDFTIMFRCHFHPWHFFTISCPLLSLRRYYAWMLLISGIYSTELLTVVQLVYKPGTFYGTSKYQWRVDKSPATVTCREPQNLITSSHISRHYLTLLSRFIYAWTFEVVLLLYTLFYTCISRLLHSSPPFIQRRGHQLTIQSVEWLTAEEIERPFWPNRDTIPEFAWRNWGNPGKMSGQCPGRGSYRAPLVYRSRAPTQHQTGYMTHPLNYLS
jgi:hypothetical protein